MNSIFRKAMRTTRGVIGNMFLVSALICAALALHGCGGDGSTQVSTLPATDICSTHTPGNVNCAAQTLQTVWIFGGTTTNIEGGNTTDGITPTRGVVSTLDGKLVGFTLNGGQFGKGTIYRFDPKTNQETLLYQFDGGADGTEYPTGKLIQARDGLLYGVTSGSCTFVPAGSGTSTTIASSCGRIFSIDPATGIFTALFAFDGGATFGGKPGLGLVQGIGTDDSFYGVTQTGGANGTGTIFQFNLTKSVMATSLQTLYSFDSSKGDGIAAPGPLLIGPDHSLYGTSKSGGANNGYGTLFNFDPAKQTMNILHTFANGADGAKPNGSLTLVSGTMIYGTAQSAGAGSGTIFSFALGAGNSTSAFSSIAFPQNPSAPASPMAGLTIGIDRNLYGTTPNGGTNNNGTLYQFNPGTSAITTLVFFDTTNSIFPNSDLTIASDGHMFGTTYYAQSNQNAGTLFKY